MNPTQVELILNILLFAVVNSFLIGFLLIINKKGNRAANRFYGFLTLSLSAVALENILIMSGDIFKVPHFLSAGAIMMILVPPFGYLLYRHLMEPKKKTTIGVLLLHMLPFFICTLTLVPFFQLSAEIKLEIVRDIYYEHQEIRGFSLLYSALNILQFIIYNILIARSIRKQRSTKAKKSQRFGVSWMNILLITLNTIVGMYIVLYLSFIYTTEFQPILIVIFITLMVTTIYLTGYHLVKNPFYFSTYKASYEKSPLKSETVKDLDERLNMLLTDQKPFLNSDIKLTEVASQLDVSPHQLSQFINQSKEISFTELINSFRIKHAAELLKIDSSKGQTILAIALESGFSNQANFIKVFKENTGLTPSEFRRQASE